MAVPAVMETKPKDIIPQFTAIPGVGGGGGGSGNQSQDKYLYNKISNGNQSQDKYLYNKISNGNVGLPSQPYRGNCG